MSSPLSGSVSKLIGGVSDSPGVPIWTLVSISPSLNSLFCRVVSSGAELLVAVRTPTWWSEPELDLELALLAPLLGLKVPDVFDGGQHLEVSHGGDVGGPFGQASIQSWTEHIQRNKRNFSCPYVSARYRARWFSSHHELRLDGR